MRLALSIGFALVFLLVAYKGIGLSISGTTLEATVLKAFQVNPYAIHSSKDIPGTFSFQYQFTKIKPKKGQANFDVPIAPFDEKKAQAALLPAQTFGPIRDAWGYPVRENAYMRLALGKPARERTALGTKIAYAADPGSIPGEVNCRANTGVTGYFEAYFEDVALHNHVGYDDDTHGQARRDRACQVLQDIATLIKLDQTNVTPDILFAVNPGNMPAGALAAASAYSGYYSTGPDNGSLSKHIISHIDPTPQNGSFDAFVFTNFSPSIGWDVDSSLNANTYDLYTVLYHEVLHALGFRGLLPATISATNAPYQHSTFDAYTYKDSTLSNPFFNVTSEFLQTPIGAPSSWFITNTDVYQGIKNKIGATPDGIRPVYSPLSWEQGSSLSHFDMARAGGKIYIMNPSIGTNTTRTIHNDEKEVLCHEGYQVSGLVGCEDATPWAEKDIANVLGSNGVPVTTCISILTNDYSLSGGSLSVHDIEHINIQPGDTLTYYSGVNCTGTSSSTFTGASSVKLTPSTSILSRSFSYTVEDSISHRISFPTTVSFLSARCSSNPDEYVCNGDFEQPFVHDSWFNQYASSALGLSLFEYNGYCSGAYCAVPFWNALYGTADVFSSLPGFYSFFHLPLGVLNNPHGGSSIGRVLITKGSIQDPSYNYYEPIITNLKTPLTVGTSYQVSFDVVAIHDPSNLSAPSDPNILEPQYCIGFDTNIPPYLINGSWAYGVAQPVNYSCQNIVLDPNGGVWTHVSYNFTPTVAYQYFIASGEFQRANATVLSGMSLFFDNFSITPTPVTVGSISGLVYLDQNSNSVHDNSESGLDGVQVALYKQGTANPVQTIITQTSPHSGEYAFNNLPDGTYYEVIGSENLYPLVTEPGVHTGLVSGYSHVRTVVISGGQASSNNNFGIVLASDLCSNISGIQPNIPSGYQQVGTQCDACPNIDSVQSAVPSGYTNVNGQCIKNATDTTSVTDVCPNLTGVQTTVPAGYTLIRGQCLKVMKTSTTDITKVNTSNDITTPITR